MIRHTAVFRLKHAAGSAAERDFLARSPNSKPFPAFRNSRFCAR